MKKIIKLVLVFIAFAIMIPPTVLADAPAPPQSLWINVDNAPQTVAYYDLLISKSMAGGHFGSVNRAFQKKHPELMNSQLAAYHENGFFSYSMYFENANSPLIPLGEKTALLTKDEPNSFIFGQGNFKILTQFKIAAIDQKGNILKVSPIVNMKPKSNGFYVYVTYDYTKNIASPYFYPYFNYYKLFLVILIVLRILFTVIIETLIAIPFGIRPLRVVVYLNLISEVVLTIGMHYINVPYLQSLFLFEAIAVLIELFGLMKFSKHPSPLKVTAFVLVANAITLCLGLWLNSLGIFIA